MHGIAVALLSEDRDRLVLLQHRLEGTTLGHAVFSHSAFPISSTDPVLRQIQDLRAEIVLVDIDPLRPQRSVAVIELLKATTNDIAVFAIGEMNHPPTIVTVMRAGACEYLESTGDSISLQDALARFSASRTRIQSGGGRARVFTFLNAKGGSGATTIAVNTAMSLQKEHGATVLVDFAPLGHAALHLDVRPVFGLADALQNLHRLDPSLLKGFVTTCKGDLHLLAGLGQVSSATLTATELARLFDLLVTQYRYVVVDCSSRTDEVARVLCDLAHQILLVAQTDVVALWSTSRIQSWLQESSTPEKIGLVINRFKKIPGFTDEDVRRSTNCRVLWKIPNQYHQITAGIERGEPISLQDGEVTRSFRGFAAALAQAGSAETQSEQKTESHNKVGGRLLISPLRAGQS